MSSSASSTGKTAWVFWICGASSPRERKHFLDKRDHPGSFLLNIQQMFIVPAYFRREKFGIGTNDGEWGFQLMTGIGNKFFLG